MADAALDLLIHFETVDATPGHPARAEEDRQVTNYMLSMGFSETEIGVCLGWLPESALSDPHDTPVPERPGLG
jgi:hypothetical protein